MKILMIAPEPFFQPRGTPFSEYYRIRCLCELGHEVDLVTYPIGNDIEIPSLRIIRAGSVPGIKDIGIGPSLAKIPLDTRLFLKSWRQIGAGGYDLIHSHEEGGIMGVFLSKMFGVPHVYDMHSSLPQQLSNFRFTSSRLVRMAFHWMEETVLNSADAVIAICPSLVDQVKKINQRTHVTLIENTAESHDVDIVPREKLDGLRESLGLGNKKIILYIGTFEAYQGLDLLLEAAAILAPRRRNTTLLLVGGRSGQVEKVKEAAAQQGLDDFCVFTGQVPHAEVPPFLKLADVVISPRSRGTNTPLKIYSYLRSGAPIVATDLPTHTQVLNSDVAMLVPPEPEALAFAVERVLDDAELSQKLTAAAFNLSEKKYSYEKYVEKTKTLFGYLENIANGS